MTDDLNFRLTKNDASEEFRLRVSSVEPTISNGLAVRSIVSGIGGLAGGDPVLNKETYQVNGVVRAAEAVDYPNSGTYADHNLGLETELRRAAKEWGPDTTDGFDTITWDTRTIEGVITEMSPREDRDQTKGRDYSFTMEFTHVDVYIG